MVYSPEALTSTVTGLLNGAAAALAALPDGNAPARVALVPGAVSWDTCQCAGELYGTVLATGLASVFPTPAPDASGLNCPPPYVVVTVGVAMLRCAPVPDTNGNPPSTEAQAASAAQVLTDAATIRASVTCGLRALVTAGSLADWAIGAEAPLGPEGGCTGTTLSFTLGFLNGDCGC
jgi:hypothetical protein